MKTVLGLIGALLLSAIGFSELYARCRCDGCQCERKSQRVAMRGGHRRHRFMQVPTQPDTAQPSMYPNTTIDVGASAQDSNDGWICNGRSCYRVKVQSVRTLQRTDVAPEPLPVAPKVELKAVPDSTLPDAPRSTNKPKDDTSLNDTEPNRIENVGGADIGNPWFPDVPVVRKNSGHASMFCDR